MGLEPATVPSPAQEAPRKAPNRPSFKVLGVVLLLDTVMLTQYVTLGQRRVCADFDSNHLTKLL